LRSVAGLSIASLAIIAVGVVVSTYRGQADRAAPTAVVSEPGAGPEAWQPRSLSPVANPNADAEAQPQRLRPYRVALSSDASRAYVTLPGKVAAPNDEIAVVDLAARDASRRVKVGSHPYGIALHPSGQWILVTNRFSNYVSVVDTTRDEEVAKIPVPYYCDDIALAPDGSAAYLSNFWKDQVIVVNLTATDDGLSGRVRENGYDRDAFFGQATRHEEHHQVCASCGYESAATGDPCPRCGHAETHEVRTSRYVAGSGRIHKILRSRCGMSGCHLYRTGGYLAGPDASAAYESAVVHAFPSVPENSPLLRAAVSTRFGGWADGTNGYHHAGGVVFDDPETDLDYLALRKWIGTGHVGPGIPVGDAPRDMVVSARGGTLFVANTGSLDVSVVDLRTMLEVRRIAMRSPVNDVTLVDGKLVAATLGVGSGHPKQRDPNRESTDRNNRGADVTIHRDPTTGAVLPLDSQHPLGPFDDVDGTAAEGFRDVSNDIVVLERSTQDTTAYAATDEFTRYTSDTFEALAHDAKGDVPAELMRVVGAFPDQIARDGDRVYVTMAGTNQVQEWRFAADAAPADRLSHVAVHTTGIGPSGIAIAGGTLVVADRLGDTITLIDRAAGTSETIALAASAPAYPATDVERGELAVRTSLLSADGDTSCVHCHYRDSADGKKWSVAPVSGQGALGGLRSGGSRQVPDLRALVHDVPFNVEGILSIDEALATISEQAPLAEFARAIPAGDYSELFASEAQVAAFQPSASTSTSALGTPWTDPRVRLVDLVARRDAFFRTTTKELMGQELDIRGVQRVVGAFQAGESRLLPNPEDPNDPMVLRGRELFDSPEVGCAACHPAPGFADKKVIRNDNRAFTPLVTAAPRDTAHTLLGSDWVDTRKGYRRDWDPDDVGRIEAREGHYTTPGLRGLWSRPARLLHHGGAITVRETLCTPGHPALAPLEHARLQAARDGWERGLNERDGVPDTHGATSHLSVWDIECLHRYLLSIE
jgi:YVTN family beta-propeller protein